MDVPSASTPLDDPRRTSLLRRALHLEILTVGWNIAEGSIAVASAVAAGSVALFGFGIDSFVESVEVRLPQLLWEPDRPAE